MVGVYSSRVARIHNRIATAVQNTPTAFDVTDSSYVFEVDR